MVTSPFPFPYHAASPTFPAAATDPPPPARNSPIPNQIHGYPSPFPAPTSGNFPTPTLPYAAQGSTPPSAQPWVASSPNPGLFPVQFSQPLSAEPAATAPVRRPDRVPSTPISCSRSSTLSWLLDAIPTAPYQECRPPRCHDSVSPATSIAFPSPRMCAISLLERPDMAPLLALPKAKSTSLTEMEPVLNAPTIQSAEAQVQAEATISKDVSRAVLDLKRRLDAQLARDWTSFDTIKAELAKLTSLAAQLVASIDKQSSVAASPSSSSLSSPVGASSAVSTLTFASVSATSASTKPSTTSYVAQQAFGEMPTPISWQGTDGTSPNYCSGHHDPIQSTCVSNLKEQNLDEMPQQYDFHNLNCESLFLADGTEHSYYALPENYPVERATTKHMSDVYDDKTDDASNESVDVSQSNPEKQPYEEDSAFPSITTDLRDLPLELQQQEDENPCNCPVLKASDSVVTSFSQLSSEHSMRELRLLWDPGATKFPVLFTTSASATESQGRNVFKSEFTCNCDTPKLLNFLVNLKKMILWPCCKLQLSHPSKLFKQSLCETISVIVTERRQHLVFHLMNEMVQKGSEFKDGQLAYVAQVKYLCSLYPNSLLKTEYCQMSCLWEFSVSFTSLRFQFGVPTRVLQQNCYCRLPSSHENHGIQFLWDPGILSIMGMTLGKTAVPNRVHSGQTPCEQLIFIGQPVDLKKFSAQLLLQSSSLYNNLKAFLQVHYCCLPFILDCLYSQRAQQPVCYAHMFSSTEAILSAICLSPVTTLCMFLSCGKIAKEGRDACCLVSAILPPTQIASYCPSNIKVGELTSRYLVFHPNQIDSWASTISQGIASSEYAYSLDFHYDQWEFFNQQDVHENYSAKHLLLSSQKYLLIKEMDIIFSTFRPP